MKDYTPHPYFERPLLPPLAPPAPLPGLTVRPFRMESETLRADIVDDPSAIDDLLAKVTAEDARLRRLLPPAPSGYRWEGELQTHEPVLDFTRNAGTIEARLVYRLVGIDPDRSVPLWDAR